MSQEIRPLRILYIGARLVGYRCLCSLIDIPKTTIAGVLSLDDSMAERTTAHQSFDQLVARYRISHRRFVSLKDPSHCDWARSLAPDLGIVVGVSQIIRPPLLHIPPKGIIGMHPTLLPEGRGRAPIPWAIIKGLSRTGVTLFFCTQQADCGDLIAQCAVPIFYEDDCESLGRRTDKLAAELLRGAIGDVVHNRLKTIVQNEADATTWPQRRPDDGAIDWSMSSRAIYDWVRALTHPYPGAFTSYQERRLWVWRARQSDDERRGKPGEILAVMHHGLLVATGEGNVLLTSVQWQGADEQEAGTIELSVGARLGPA